jgi:hypothetical protein
MGISFCKGMKYCKFVSMAKAIKKPAKEASSLFHIIMAASVKGNPKPVEKPKKGKSKKK